MEREEKKERSREAEGLNPPGISVSNLPAQLAGWKIFHFFTVEWR